MLDINLLRNDIDKVISNVVQKRFFLDKDYFNHIEARRKTLQVKMEELQAQRNHVSKQIGILKARGEDATTILAEVANLGDELKLAEHEFTMVQDELTNWLYGIPNLLDASVPEGKDETYNQEVRRFGVPRQFEFQVKDHVDLGSHINKEVDFETAAKMSGSRFVVLKNQIARLHRALTQFMLDTHIEEHGYTETYIPYIVNAKAVLGTGQLPKFETDLFKVKHGDIDMYLISTAEISLTNTVADTVLKVEDLPIKLVAHSPCFRSEAGSYGRDTRGMIRMHQFDKVEMVQIINADKSYSALEEMVNHAENILKKLGLPYRVVTLCSGDTGFSAAKTYDLEVWIPSQRMYREISSCSNMTDYQMRRLHGRYKNVQGKNELLHSLNGSGLAVGRTLVAVMENYQNADGSITVPDVLQPYMKCSIISVK
ncbi:MAG: serine--tRNA ligase [Burkholderiales bacterium]|nr:serine--tRNA ligase [Burkholderiales bacterium]